MRQSELERTSTRSDSMGDEMAWLSSLFKPQSDSECEHTHQESWQDKSFESLQVLSQVSSPRKARQNNFINNFDARQSSTLPSRMSDVESAPAHIA